MNDVTGIRREAGVLDAQRLNTLALMTAYSVAPDETLAYLDRHLDRVGGYMEAGLTFEDAWAAARRPM